MQSSNNSYNQRSTSHSSRHSHSTTPAAYAQQQAHATHPYSQEGGGYYAHSTAAATPYPGTQPNDIMRSLSFTNYAQHDTTLGGNAHSRGSYVVPQPEGATNSTEYSSYNPAHPSYSVARPSLSHATSHPSHPPVQSPQFIPTPSQTYQEVNYSRRPHSELYPSPTQPHYQHHSVSPPHHSQTGRGVHATAPSTTPTGERVQCELCDRTFTRAHDRKRHCATVHAANPQLHRCPYCQRDFSRMDSLKRHKDNGCEDMPTRS